MRDTRPSRIAWPRALVRAIRAEPVPAPRRFPISAEWAAAIAAFLAAIGAIGSVLYAARMDEIARAQLAAAKAQTVAAVKQAEQAEAQTKLVEKQAAIADAQLRATFTTNLYNRQVDAITSIFGELHAVCAEGSRQFGPALESISGLAEAVGRPTPELTRWAAELTDAERKLAMASATRLGELDLIFPPWMQYIVMAIRLRQLNDTMFHQPSMEHDEVWFRAGQLWAALQSCTFERAIWSCVKPLLEAGEPLRDHALRKCIDIDADDRALVRKLFGQEMR